MGEKGICVLNVLKYLNKIGLLANSACTDPQERNLHAEFIKSDDKTKLDWFERVENDEVVYGGPPMEETGGSGYHTVLLVESFTWRTENGGRQYVIVQTFHGIGYAFNGFLAMPVDIPDFLEFWIPIVRLKMNCFVKVIYGGPPMEETGCSDYHTVLLAGSFTLRTENDGHQYVIVQNSHGIDYTFNGFVAMRVDIPDFFLEFWIPIARPKMNCFVKCYSFHIAHSASTNGWV